MVLILAYPGDVYKGMLESEVAVSYDELAKQAFAENIRFSPEYVPFKDKPDYLLQYSKKGLNFEMSAFIEQPAEGFGSIATPFLASSYLFNPTHNLLVLPDLDVIHIDSGHDSLELADEIQDFYKSFGWQTGLGRDILTLQVPNMHPTRPNKPRITILNPKNIIGAARAVGYNPQELYFRPN
jgi:hypothetical protein